MGCSTKPSAPTRLGYNGSTVQVGRAGPQDHSLRRPDPDSSLPAQPGPRTRLSNIIDPRFRLLPFRLVRKSFLADNAAFGPLLWFRLAPKVLLVELVCNLDQIAKVLARVDLVKPLGK